VLRIRSFQQLGGVFDELKAGKTKYKTVVLDSITEMQKFGMYDIMKRAIEKDDERDPDLPGIGEWGKNTEQMRRLIRAFRDLPMNTLFIALANADRTNKGRTIVKPSLSGKLANEIAGFLDIVVYLYKKEIDDEQHRVMLTMGTEEYIAKDRTDKLPPTIIDPDMEMVHKIITS
jgi:hypothetical protein